MNVARRNIAIAFICVFLLTLLCGCQDRSAESFLKDLDNRLLRAHSKDFANCTKYNLQMLEFPAPDTIILIRDDKVVGEYEKGNAVYEEIFTMHSHAIQEYLKKELKPLQTKGIVGSPVQTTEGIQTALLGGTYLVYSYKDNGYAPAYFQINTPKELSQVSSAQPVLEGELRGPFGYVISQQLWDYLQNV